MQPWGVVRQSGRWYVVGHDRDRDAERVFRLSRVRGPVRTVGPPGAYDVPPSTDVREIARRLAPPTEIERVVLLAREGTAHGFRQPSARVEVDVVGPDQHTRWDRIELDRPTMGLADDVLSHGPDVVLLDPPSVRDRVVARLTEAVG